MLMMVVTDFSRKVTIEFLNLQVLSGISTWWDRRCQLLAVLTCN